MSIIRQRSSSILHAIPPCLGLSLTGCIYCLGIFALPVEQSASIPNALQGTWTTAIGFMHVFSAPVMILSALFLDRKPGLAPSPNARIRLLSVLSSLCFLGLAFAAYGIQRSSVFLVTVSVVLQAVPLGVNFYLYTEILTAHFPASPGLVVGFAMLSYDSGVILCSYVFQYLITWLGCRSALLSVGLSFSIVGLSVTFFLSYPPSLPPSFSQKQSESPIPHPPNLETTPLVSQHHSMQETGTSSSEDLKPRIDNIDDSIRMPRSSLVRSIHLWLYIFLVFTGGGANALNAFYFKIGDLFHKTPELLVSLYQLSGVLQIFVGLTFGYLCDNLHTSRGFLRLGSKNVAIVAMMLQTILFIVLVPLSKAENFWAAIIAVTVLIMETSIHYGLAPILARELFGAANSGFVFGIGGGLAFGAGEGFSVVALSIASQRGRGEDGYNLVPSSYNGYYWFASGWSAIGLICALVMTECSEGFSHAGEGFQH